MEGLLQPVFDVAVDLRAVRDGEGQLAEVQAAGGGPPPESRIRANFPSGPARTEGADDFRGAGDQGDDARHGLISDNSPQDRCGESMIRGGRSADHSGATTLMVRRLGLKVTMPSARAKRVSSLPMPTFRPGW